MCSSYKRTGMFSSQGTCTCPGPFSKKLFSKETYLCPLILSGLGSDVICEAGLLLLDIIPSLKLTLNSSTNKKQFLRTFLVVQWLRIHLPKQGTGILSLIWEDSTCRETTKQCTSSTESELCNKKSHHNEKPVRYS